MARFRLTSQARMGWPPAAFSQVTEHGSGMPSLAYMHRGGTSLHCMLPAPEILEAPSPTRVCSPRTWWHCGCQPALGSLTVGCRLLPFLFPRKLPRVTSLVKEDDMMMEPSMINAGTGSDRYSWEESFPDLEHLG